MVLEIFFLVEEFDNAPLVDIAVVAGGCHTSLVHKKHHGALAVGDECIVERGNQMARTAECSGVKGKGNYGAVGSGAEVDESCGVELVATTDMV